MTKLRIEPTRVPTAKPKSKRDPAPPATPISTLPTSIRRQAQWADEFLGNKNGTLDPKEVKKFADKYGGRPEYVSVIKKLQDAVAEKPQATTPVAPASTSAKTLAAELTIAGGSAGPKDVELVAAEVAKVPVAVLERARAAGLKVVACRTSITDYCTELKGVHPRGWPPGATWDTVPGVYDPKRKQVVIATTGTGTGRHVPTMGEGHGAYNLLLHEFAHGMDHRDVVKTLDSESTTFKKAYEADRKALEAAGLSYLLQTGVAGRQEAFAESFAREVAKDPGILKTMPHLAKYWEQGLAK